MILPASATVDLAHLAYLDSLAADEQRNDAFVRVLRAYYAGEHPTHLDDRQLEFIGLRTPSNNRRGGTRDLGPTFSSLWADNVAALVVDSIVEHLQLVGLKALDDTTEAGEAVGRMWEWYDANDLDSDANDLHVAAGRDGRAYILVGPPTVARPYPRLVWHEAYDGTSGVKVRRNDDGDVVYAIKQWTYVSEGEADKQYNGRLRRTAYYPDRIEKYVLGGKGWQAVTDAKDEPWPITWVDARGEPLGVPVFELHPQGWVSDIERIMSLQDALNKSELDLLASADMAGFPVLAATGVTPEMGSDNEPVDVKMAPGKVLYFPDKDSEVKRLEAADLGPIIAVCLHWVSRIASNTKMPQHLFHPQSQHPSADTLEFLYAGLKGVVGQRRQLYGNGWEQAFACAARVWNAFAPRDRLPVDDPRIAATWKPDTFPVDKAAVTAELQAKLALGVPQRQIWHEMGYSENLITQWVTENAERQASSDVAALEALVRASQPATPATLAEAIPGAEAAAEVTG